MRVRTDPSGCEVEKRGAFGRVLVVPSGRAKVGLEESLTMGLVIVSVEDRGLLP